MDIIGSNLQGKGMNFPEFCFLHEKIFYMLNLVPLSNKACWV